jgi:hypothetical protein
MRLATPGVVSSRGFAVLLTALLFGFPLCLLYLVPRLAWP